MKVVDTRALIDSRASISCIDWGFVRKHKLPAQRLKTPIQAQNVDNSVNSKGVIWFTTTLFLNIGGIARQVTLYIMNLGNENVILGLPWLKELNPMINWIERTLSIKESLDQCQELFCSFSVDTKRHKSRFTRPSVKPPRHTNVNAIVDQHLSPTTTGKPRMSTSPAPGKIAPFTESSDVDPALFQQDPQSSLS